MYPAMKYARRSAQRGFSLVELMLVVAIIGILSSVALPAFSKYVKKARTSEAIGYLDKMWKGAVAYYEADHADTNTVQQAKQFPGGATCNIEGYPGPGYCCNGPRNRCPGNNSIYSQSGATTPWVALGFNIADDHLYVPAFFARSPTGPSSIDARMDAYGNLDCDGVVAQFTVYGTANNQKKEPARGGLYILNETE
jgi:prepilin-type N-terminal cleavage/methylation domain-containing protein